MKSVAFLLVGLFVGWRRGRNYGLRLAILKMRHPMPHHSFFGGWFCAAVEPCGMCQIRISDMLVKISEGSLDL